MPSNEQANKAVLQIENFWFSYWVKSTILSLRNRPSLPLSLNMHGVNQNAFIVSFQKIYDKLELPCLVEEWHDKDFTLYTANRIWKLYHGFKPMKHISEQKSVHNQEYILMYIHIYKRIMILAITINVLLLIYTYIFSKWYSIQLNERDCRKFCRHYHRHI